MIDLALDPSDTRPLRAPPARTSRLRMVALALVGASALGGFGVAASTLMAGLAAPAPVKRASQSRAADWPDLKDGLPVLAGTSAATPPKPAAPEAPALRMASLPDPIGAPPTPPKPALPAATSAAPRPIATTASPIAAAAPEPATKRIPNATPVTAIGPARQVMPLAPARTAALQPPRASETIRARTEAEPAAEAEPVRAAAAAPPASIATPTGSEKPQRKAVAVRRSIPATSTAAPAAVASAEASEPEETEVLGIKLPSLAPAGKKLREGVDALGEAVRNVF